MLPCAFCYAPAQPTTRLNNRLIPVCDSCLAKATAAVLPACPACGATPRPGRTATPQADDTRLYEIIASAPTPAPGTPAKSWREFVRLSGLGTKRASAARDRLIAEGRIELYARGSDGALLYRTTAPAVP